MRRQRKDITMRFTYYLRELRWRIANWYWSEPIAIAIGIMALIRVSCHVIRIASEVFYG